ncbi:MAG TPA: hypothetical protein VFM82_10830 [Flavobacteriaceae bacterium]|nr:hypothetical protein [Flavobacteriaceae bacterium]
MKKGTTITIVFLMCFSVFAQQKAVEEIYAKYFQAIGSENSKNVANVQAKLITTSENTAEIRSNILGDSKNNVETNSKIISFTDYVGKYYASISYSITSFGNVLSRTLQSNGKGYFVMEDGTKTEYPVTVDIFKNGYASETIPPGSERMPDEVFKEEEVYVVKCELEKTLPTIKKNTQYTYFSKSSGLIIGSKQITSILIENPTVGNTAVNSTTINDFKDYKEIGGILVAHRIDTTIESETNGPNMKNTSLTNSTQIYTDIQFNTDMESFKSNCFQKPKECIAAF